MLAERQKGIIRMQLPTLVELLEAGVHFGHETSRWNPKMQSYIFTTRNRVHVLDLQQTLTALAAAAAFARQVVAKGGVILFVGTKRQARSIVKFHAERCGMLYVTTRWLGGTFTNFETILKSITKLDALRAKRSAPEAEVLTKKERAVIHNEIRRLEEVLEGLKGLRKVPEAVFLVGAHDEKIAAKEAQRKRIPIIALVDTNADPEEISYPIPANDDAVRSIDLLVRVIADAVLEGRQDLTAAQSADAASGRTTVKPVPESGMGADASVAGSPPRPTL
jgi:small subunit ribosomal protein S2